MKNLNSIKYIYLLGIGGIGMSALARYFNAHGKKVCGYDRTKSHLTDELVAEGVNIHFDDNISDISKEVLANKNEALIIYTPAIPHDHSELRYFEEKEFILKKRSEVLGMIAKEHYTLAVAGTHGKTTTSSLLAHLLTESGKKCTAFLGGVTQNYNTNLLISPNDKIMVVEADEYDRSFLTLHPDVAIITSMDADHLDIYGNKDHVEESYLQFASQVKPEGHLIYKKGLTIPKGTSMAQTYSVNEEADFYAKNISVKEGRFVFDFISKEEKITNIEYHIPGRHNIENAVAASAAALKAGVSASDIKHALSTFKGVKRRFEYHIKNKNLIYIDDYAHHPAELKACISAVKELYPDKKITGIFQPHLFSRTRDFANDFAKSLSMLDTCILLDIYPARELPIPGVTSEILLKNINSQQKYLLKKEEVIPHLLKHTPEILITVGAGDIDMMVEPIKNALDK